MVRGDRVGDRLQEHRLAGARRRDDQAALPFADRRDEVEHARRHVVRHFELDAVLGIERREVVEEDLLARDVGMLEVDRLDFDQGEVALAFLRRAHLAGDGVAGAQVEAADLRRRNVDVVRTGQVVVLGRAQEAEAVRQALQHAFGEDQARLLGLRLQDREDQVLLAHAGGVLDAELLGDLGEIGKLHLLEHADVERLGGLGLLARGSAAARRRLDSSGASFGDVDDPLGGAASARARRQASATTAGASSTAGAAAFSAFGLRVVLRTGFSGLSLRPAARLRRRSIRFRILFRHWLNLVD